MSHMETESQAIDRLRSEGFTVDFRLDDAGLISSDGGRSEPADVVIHQLLRFEGYSNPDDEAMVLALETPDGQRGTLALPYGPDMTAEQVKASRQLILAHRDGPTTHI